MVRSIWGTLHCTQHSSLWDHVTNMLSVNVSSYPPNTTLSEPLHLQNIPLILNCCPMFATVHHISPALLAWLPINTTLLCHGKAENIEMLFNFSWMFQVISPPESEETPAGAEGFNAKNFNRRIWKNWGQTLGPWQTINFERLWQEVAEWGALYKWI